MPPLGQHLGQAPVHHLHLAERPHHDVRRLQVAVDHSLGVGVRQRLGDLQGDGQQPRPVRRRVGALGQEGLQRLALDQLHGEERPRAEAADVVDRHHAGVLQLAADLRLLEEAPGDFWPSDILLQQHLDGHVAAAQHRPHAAAGNLALELVAVAGLLRRWHGIGLGLHDMGALALRFLQEHRPHGAQAGARRSCSAKARGQAGVERVGRHEGSVNGVIEIVRLVHGILSAFRGLLNQDQAKGRFRATILEEL
jgi:hypothetical protein